MRQGRLRRGRGIIWLVILSWLLTGVVACQQAPAAAPSLTSTAATAAASAAAPSASALPVVVSIPVLTSLVQSVGGQWVQVTSLVPPGSDPHTYQPTPGQAKIVAAARIIFINGLGLEASFMRLIQSAAPGTPVITLAEGLSTIQATPEPGETSESGETEGNPHLWLDPDNAIVYVQRIAQGLSQVDPAHAGAYQANAERTITAIRDFDRQAKAQIASIPPERRKLVTFHDAFPYFARHYGLQLVGVLEPSPGHEPSPQELARLVDEIKAQHVPAIYTEPQFNPRLAQTIAQEAGVKVLELYSDTPPDEQDYLGMMRLNVQHIVEGLGAG
ncbi:metal ABC transporter substrate-binding protein [Thermorudis peleae]|uniref:metal ABC transporter substrate-binding protein n=1 Tax=Thermorudis peleae TaxID=1382356 RepID=UPI00056F8254|nr:metal ABC transporter substrate-binding protein [Thermorudis peleae]